MKNQQKQKKKQENSLESLYALMHENEEKSIREWDRIKKEREEDWRKREEDRLKREEEWQKRNEEWQKIREEEKKRSDEIDRKLAENARQIDENNKLIGAIGNSNGDVAEEYFQNAFIKNPRLNGETYDKVITNMKMISEKGSAEFDIFLSNGKSAAIIEIKYNVRKDDIKELLQKAEKFRKAMSEYSNLKLYLGIASLSFRKITEQNIMKEGIAVIKQVGDKMVVYDKNLKVF